LFTGIFAQYIFLPVITIALVYLLSPAKGIALGMILVAACPGGNASNFFSLLAKGNVALSVTLSAITSVFAFVLTPVSFVVWASTVPDLADSIRELNIDFLDLLGNMVAILFVPLVVGMTFAHYFPQTTEKISKTVRILSVVMLIGFILAAINNNKHVFAEHIFTVFWIVVLHNGAGLLGAYFISKLLKNSEDVNRSVAIESGIQNSGLGLVLIFTFFDGNGSMAIVAAWWGVWHLVSGFLFATYMRQKPISFHQ
jgi:BASS family bile acid:Na+ symporter